MKQYAIIYPSGLILFKPGVPREGIPLLRHLAEHPEYKNAIKAMARLAYDNKTLLVPGIPEAKTLNEKLDALTRFCRLVEDYMLIQTAAKNAGI